MKRKIEIENILLIDINENIFIFSSINNEREKTYDYNTLGIDQ